VPDLTAPPGPLLVLAKGAGQVVRLCSERSCAVCRHCCIASYCKAMVDRVYRLLQ
jgi:hypothetical protein